MKKTLTRIRYGQISGLEAGLLAGVLFFAIGFGLAVYVALDLFTQPL